MNFIEFTHMRQLYGFRPTVKYEYEMPEVISFEEVGTPKSGFYNGIIFEISVKDICLNATHKVLLLKALDDLSESCQRIYNQMNHESARYILDRIVTKVYQALNHEDGALHLLILVRAIQDAYSGFYSWDGAQDEPALYEVLQ